MKKGEHREGIVLKVRFPNKGLVRLLPKEEETQSEQGAREEQSTREVAPAIEQVVVKNVLPGQKILLRITKKRGGQAEGQLLSVLEPSPDEVAPPCPHAGYCGGCTYLALPYEKELALKEQQVYELLKDVLGEQGDWHFEGIKPSPRPYGFRNKMEFTFGDAWKDGPLALGMHRRGSYYDIVSVRDCQIVDEDYRRILNAVLDFFNARGVSYYHRYTHLGYLRHLLVRKAAGTGEILLALVTTTQTGSDFYRQAPPASPQSEPAMLEDFTRLLLQLPLSGHFSGILHIRNDSVADVVRSDETRILYGREDLEEELMGLRFRVSVFSFFQTNTFGAEILYRTAREYIGDVGHGESVVYDLYSGTGTIAQLMAPVARKVIGVEIVEEAVEAARENARLNGIDNCEFIAGDVLRVLDQLKDRPDFIILDPPRDGIHPKALGKILDYGVERLVYISCKPTSLVRDLKEFLQRGYRVTRAVAVDQFPWAAQVETVCLIERIGS